MIRDVPSSHFVTYNKKDKLNQIIPTFVGLDYIPPSKLLLPAGWWGGRDSSWLSVFSAWFPSAAWIISDFFNVETSSNYYYCTWWLSSEASLIFCWEEKSPPEATAAAPRESASWSCYCCNFAFYWEITCCLFNTSWCKLHDCLGLNLILNTGFSAKANRSPFKPKVVAPKAAELMGPSPVPRSSSSLKYPPDLRSSLEFPLRSNCSTMKRGPPRFINRVIYYSSSSIFAWFLASDLSFKSPELLAIFWA